MDASDVVTIVKEQVDAYNTRDIDGVMRYYADIRSFWTASELSLRRVATGSERCTSVSSPTTGPACRRPNGFQRRQLGRDTFDSAELGDAGRLQAANAVDRGLPGE
jgi:hypothetical protein